MPHTDCDRTAVCRRGNLWQSEWILFDYDYYYSCYSWYYQCGVGRDGAGWILEKNTH